MIEIVCKTDDYVVIYKPAGMPSQSDPGGDPDAMTLCSEVLRENGENDRLYLIHRLDRVVGGLMVFARNKEIAAELSAQVSEHSFGKWYYAVVCGVAGEGTLFDYLYKDQRLNKAFVAEKKRTGAKTAELSYKTLEVAEMAGQSLSLVKIELKTGRFHQIRAQFSSRKMPLIGDKKYGSRDFKAKMPSLFATEIKFCVNGKEIKVSRLPNVSGYPWSIFNEESYR